MGEDRPDFARLPYRVGHQPAVTEAHPEIVIKLADRLHQYGEMSGRGLPKVAARPPPEPRDRAPRPRGRRRVCVARAPRGSDF